MYLDITYSAVKQIVKDVAHFVLYKGPNTITNLQLALCQPSIPLGHIEYIFTKSLSTTTLTLVLPLPPAHSEQHWDLSAGPHSTLTSNSDC